MAKKADNVDVLGEISGGLANAADRKTDCVDREMSTAAELDSLQRRVDGWFAPEQLNAILGCGASAAEHVAVAWLAKAGKRWRPLLAACVCQALAGSEGGPSSDATRSASLSVPRDAAQRLAVAAECFHKASLIHDDIEDNDHVRYDELTLDRELGVPIALNVGDLLVGQGYELIVRGDFSDVQKVRMLQEAARCHCRLCIGQGEELAWMRQPRDLCSDAVLAIFGAKTAPAFNVALQWAALGADADEAALSSLRRYGDALGVAYQIRDDLDDAAGVDANDLRAVRPSLLLALAYEHADPTDRQALQSFWTRPSQADALPQEINKILQKTNVIQHAQGLLTSYRTEAKRALEGLENVPLRRLLCALNARILDSA